MATQFIGNFFNRSIFNPLQNNSPSKIETFTLVAEQIQKATHTQQLAIFNYIIVYPNVDHGLQEIDVEISSAINILLKTNTLFGGNNIPTTFAFNVLFLIYINVVGVERAFIDNEFNEVGFNQFLQINSDITGQNFINTNSRINDVFPYRNQHLVGKNDIVFKIIGEELLITMECSSYSQLLNDADSKLNSLISVHIREHRPYSTIGFKLPIMPLVNRDDFLKLCLRMTDVQLEDFTTTGIMPNEGFFHMDSYSGYNFSGIFTELKKITTIKFSEEINQEFESKETKEESKHQLQPIIKFGAQKFKTPDAAGKYLVRCLERASAIEAHLIVKSILGVVDSSQCSQEIQIALKSIKKYASIRTPGQEFTLLEIEVLFIAYLKIFGIVEKDNFDKRNLQQYLRECGGKEFHIEPLFVIIVKIELEFVTVRVNGKSITIKQDLKQMQLMWRATNYIHKRMLPLDKTHPYFIEDEPANLCNLLREYSGTKLVTKSQINQTVLILKRKKLAFPEEELRELLLTIPFKDSKPDRKDARAAEELIERYRKEDAMSRLITPPNDTELILLFQEQPDKWYRSLKSGKFSTSGLNKSETGKRVIFVALNSEASQSQYQTELDKFIKEFEEGIDKKCNHNLLTYDAMKKVGRETLALGEISPEEDRELRTYLSWFSDQQLSNFTETGDIITFVAGRNKEEVMPYRIEHLYNKRLERRRFIQDAESQRKMRNESAKVNKNMGVEYAGNNDIKFDDVFTEFDRIFYGRSNADTQYVNSVTSFDNFFEDEFGIRNQVKPSAPFIDEDGFEQLCNKVIEPSAPYIDDSIEF